MRKEAQISDLGSRTSDRGRRVVVSDPKIRDSRFEIPTVTAWDPFARKLSKMLKPGHVLAISGELGAGKTTFVQALAKVFGVTRRPQSPTFALMRTYALPKAVHGIKRLIHVDAYRIEDERELLPLDLDEELSDGKSLLVIEWPEKIPGWVHDHANRTIEIQII